MELASGAHDDDVLQMAHLARSRNEMAHLRTAVERDLQRHERVEEAWRRDRLELEAELAETRQKLQDALVASSVQMEAGTQDIYGLSETAGSLDRDVEQHKAYVAGLERDKRALERDHAADTRRLVEMSQTKALLTKGAHRERGSILGGSVHCPYVYVCV